MTPLGDWTVRRGKLNLTTHNTYRRETSMPPAGFEPAIPASERKQTYALARTATGMHTDPSGRSHVVILVFAEPYKERYASLIMQKSKKS
jgi:hypothetical protein